MTQEELFGKNDFDVYEKKLASGYNKNDKMVISTGKSLINVEEFYQDESGNSQWLLTTKVPMRDNNGHISGLVGITRDITERKNFEEALRTSERKYAEITKNIPGIVCQFFMKNDKAFLFTYLSEETENIYKLIPEQLMKMKDGIFYRVYPEDRDPLLDSLNKSGGDLSDLEHEYRVN